MLYCTNRLSAQGFCGQPSVGGPHSRGVGALDPLACDPGLVAYCLGSSLWVGLGFFLVQVLWLALTPETPWF